MRERFGPLSDLSDVEEVSEAIVQVLSQQLGDYEPRTESNNRFVFTLGATMKSGRTGDDDLDGLLRNLYRIAPDLPSADWEAEAGFDTIMRTANRLIASRGRPDTQIEGPSTLEILVRDETAHRLPKSPQGESVTHKVRTPSGERTVTVGPPSVDLLLRLALRRAGFERTEFLDRQRMFQFLIKQEDTKGLADGVRTRVSAMRLLRVMARPDLVSIHLEGPQGIGVDELEKLATSFRTRLAYESDVVLAPVLDVDRLESSPSQPRFLRQLHARAAEFVDSIGQGSPPGHVADQLLGALTSADEELSLRYLRAIAADNPFAAFMGYYQVLEYQMEEAWFENLSRKVAATGELLLRPDEGIRKAAKQARKFLRVSDEEVKFTELRGLQDLLEIHLDVDRLTADLSRLDIRDSGTVEYFATGNLPFVNVPHLKLADPLDANEEKELRRETATRIYAVRCAITHSKASTRRYSPYTDDLFLAREVPLVRVAAEQLLIPPDQLL
ncbi:MULTISPECIES: hypothetical protein [Streptomyces]|uniref:hypothetical protein n=1 Tax=Streptomyces TaxID=1883 RepID=UPI0004CB7CDA|nr:MULTISPECIES: hypothetical protein [Streptomyces]